MNYTAAVCAEAQRRIDERNMKARTELEARRAEIYSKAPEVAEIERQASSAVIKLSKLIISKKGNFSENFERIKRNSLDAQNYIKKILVSRGYPEDYLVIKYTCEKCSDTGFTPDGKRCACFSELAGRLSAEELNKSANMPECDFEHFSLSYYSREMNPDGVVPFEKMREVYAFCREYAESFSENSESLLMIGKTGIGKTHLSLSIAKKVIAAGFNCIYGSAVNILADIEKEHFGRADGSRDTMAAVTEAGLLVLDDLGAENHTPFYEAAIYNIVNTRINLGKPTIISTNLNQGELRAIYNERILSRVFGVYTVLPFCGTDIRQIKRIGGASRVH